MTRNSGIPKRILEENLKTYVRSLWDPEYWRLVYKDPDNPDQCFATMTYDDLYHALRYNLANPPVPIRDLFIEDRIKNGNLRKIPNDKFTPWPGKVLFQCDVCTLADLNVPEPHDWDYDNI